MLFHSVYRTTTGHLEPFSSIPKEEFLCKVTEYCIVDVPQCECFTEIIGSAPTYLDCSNRNILNFPRSVHPSIKIIHLEGNAITSLTKDLLPKNMDSIEKLYLDNNRIVDVQPYVFSGMPKLQLLGLSGNLLTRIQFGAFSNLHRLRWLHLHDNVITAIDSMAFEDNRVLNVLTLNNNLLESLTAENLDDISALVYLSNLTLDRNPWSCSCDKYWIQDHSTIISNISNIQCNGTVIVTIPDEDLLCYDLSRNILKHEYYSGPLLAVCSLSCILVLILILVYRFRYILEVLAYSKFGFRRRQTENAACIYDAIAIYDSPDIAVRAWIKDVLLGHLEPKFKLFIPDRDMIPGTVESSELVANINLSKRTLIVLSSETELNQEITFAFDVAYHRVKLEKSHHRLLLILLENVSRKKVLSIDRIDESFKAYLTTGLYINVTDKMFWEKLSFFMPVPLPLE